jgi:hypothetical protein
VSATKKPTRAKGLGISDARYAELLEAQDGHCALCPNEPKTRRLHVDHAHATGEVRGLLCFRCNRSVAYWQTSEWALRLFGYLKNAEQAQP